MSGAGDLGSELESARREASAAVARGDSGTALFCLSKVERLERRLAAIEAAGPRPERVFADATAIYRRSRRLVV